MLASLAILALAGTTLAQFTPSGALGSTVVEYRFVDATSNDNAQISINGQLQTYNAANLNVTMRIGNGVETVVGVAQSLSAYQTVNTIDAVQGTAQQLTLNVYYGASGQLLSGCSFFVQPSQQGLVKRRTLRIKQSDLTNVGVCVSGLNTCSLSVPQKTVSCDGEFVELVEDARSCASIGVRLRRTDKRCAPVRVERTGAGSALLSGESVFLTKTFAVADYVSGSPAADASLVRAQTYAIDGTSLAGLATARSYEITISDASVAVAARDTGFFKIVNVAHRDAPSLVGSPQPDSSIVTIDQSASPSPRVYHYETVSAGARAPAGVADFYELPAASYALHIYSGLNQRNNIYGNQTTPTGADEIDDASAQTLTIAANSYTLIVIETSTSSATFTRVKVRLVDVTPAAATPLGTNIKLYNEISGDSSVRLLIANAERCDVLNGGAALSSFVNGAASAVSINTLTTKPFADAATCGIATTARQVKIVTATSTCGAFTEVGSLDLGADVSASTCVERHIFITGRTYQLNDTTTSVLIPPTGCSNTCTNSGSLLSVCNNRLVTKFGGLLFSGNVLLNDGGVGALGAVVVEVPTCACAAAAATCSTVSSCDLAAKIDDVGRAVSGVGATLSSSLGGVTSAVNAVTPVVRSTASATQKICSKARDDIANVEDDVKNIDKDVGDIKDDVQNIDKDVGDIKDDVKSIKKSTGAV